MLRHLTGKAQAYGILKSLAGKLDDLFDVDKKATYILELSDVDEKHNKLQQGYRWGWVYPQIAKQLSEAGYMLGDQPYTPAAVHAETQHNFRIKNAWAKEGQVFYEYESTSNMSKKAYTLDIEQITRYYIDKYQIGIPDHRDNEYYSNIANEVLAR